MTRRDTEGRWRDGGGTEDPPAVKEGPASRACARAWSGAEDEGGANAAVPRGPAALGRATTVAGPPEPGAVRRSGPGPGPGPPSVPANAHLRAQHVVLLVVPAHQYRVAAGADEAAGGRRVAPGRRRRRRRGRRTSGAAGLTAAGLLAARPRRARGCLGGARRRLGREGRVRGRLHVLAGHKLVLCTTTTGAARACVCARVRQRTGWRMRFLDASSAGSAPFRNCSSNPPPRPSTHPPPPSARISPAPSPLSMTPKAPYSPPPCARLRPALLLPTCTSRSAVASAASPLHCRSPTSPTCDQGEPRARTSAPHAHTPTPRALPGCGSPAPNQRPAAAVPPQHNSSSASPGRPVRQGAQPPSLGCAGLARATIRQPARRPHSGPSSRPRR